MTYLQLFDGPEPPPDGGVPVRAFALPNLYAVRFVVGVRFAAGLFWSVSSKPDAYAPLEGEGYWVNLECAP